MSPHRRRDHPTIGVAWMLAATIFFAGSDALGKWLTAEYPIMQLAWLRSVIGTLMIGGYALTGSGGLGQLHSGRPGWHLLRAVVSTCLVLFMFYGLKHLELAEYSAIIFATPFIVAALSPVLLGEKVHPRAWVAIALGFAGVLLVLRPTPGHFHVAHLVTLALAAGAAVLVMTVRHLSTTENVIALNFYLYPLNLLVSAWWAFQDWKAPDATDWLLLIALGACATFALGCFIQAMRHARPATVAPLDYLRLVWTVTLGYFIWNEIPDLLDGFGIFLVAVAGIYLVRSIRALPEISEGVDPDREERR